MGTKMLTFSPAEELAGITQKAVDGIRADSDLVIGLFHLGVDVEQINDGTDSRRLLKNVTGIDMVLDGHSHTVMTAGQDGESIQSTGTKFAYIGVVVIDNESKGLESNFLVPTLIGHRLFTSRFNDETVGAEGEKIMSAVDVRETQKMADELAKQLRLTDGKIQEINWTTEIDV